MRLIVMTYLPVLPRRVVRFRRARIAPAVTGRAALRAPLWSAISIAKGCVTMRRRGPGIHRIRREAPMAAVARVTYEAQEEMGCSIALPRNDVVVATLHWPVCNSRPYLFLPLEIRSCWVS